MEIFIGLDVSVASTSVCALNADGETVNEAKVPSVPDSLVEHMRGLPCSVIAVGMNAAPLAAGAGRDLPGSGFGATHAQESGLDVGSPITEGNRHHEGAND